MKEKIKKVFLFIFKFILWCIPFFIGLFLLNENINFNQYIFTYLFVVNLVLGMNKTYENWVEISKKEHFIFHCEKEVFFHKKFCEMYNPTMYSLSMLGFCVFGHIFFNFHYYLLILLILHSYDLWDRRYLTNEIKQNMILRFGDYETN